MIVVSGTVLYNQLTSVDLSVDFYYVCMWYTTIAQTEKNNIVTYVGIDSSALVCMYTDCKFTQACVYTCIYKCQQSRRFV